MYMYFRGGVISYHNKNVGQLAGVSSPLFSYHMGAVIKFLSSGLAANAFPTESSLSSLKAGSLVSQNSLCS